MRVESMGIIPQKLFVSLKTYALLQLTLILLLPFSARSQDVRWTFLKGQGYLPYYASYGTLGTETAFNNPGPREGAANWTLNGKLYTFGGYGWDVSRNSGFLNDLWVFDPATSNWTWLKGPNAVNGQGVYGEQGVAAPENIPGCRVNSMVWVSGGKLYLFGGLKSENDPPQSHFNDLWEYDPSTNNWKWVKGSNLINQPGSQGVLGVADETNTPSCRERAATWEHEGNLFLFGGSGITATGLSYLNDLWKYDISTNNWTRLNGTADNKAPNYGLRGSSSSTYTPGSRISPATFKINNRLFLFGGLVNNGYVNDLWEFELSSNEWKWVNGPKTTNARSIYGTKGIASINNWPGARHSSAYWTTGGKFYLLGGNGYGISSQGYLNDLWEFEPADESWKWVKGESQPNQNGIFGIRGIASSSNQPGSKSGSSWWELDGKLYLFGGLTNINTTRSRLNDLWVFETSSDQWTWIKGTDRLSMPIVYGEKNVFSDANLPGQRLGALSFSYQDSLYMFGGAGSADQFTSGALNDIWVYWPPKNQWKWIKGSNIAYSGRGETPVAVYGTQGVPNIANNPEAKTGSTGWLLNDKFYAFGGYKASESLKNFYNDLWVYDIPKNTWTWINGSNTINQPAVYGAKNAPSSQNTPGARSHTTKWVCNGKLYLFGGGQQIGNVSTSEMYNDLWEYNPSDNNWTWISGSDQKNAYGVYGSLGVADISACPGARTGAQSWAYDNKLYLYGGSGFSKNNKGSLSDLWEFDLATGTWKWIKGSDMVDEKPTYGSQGKSNLNNSPGARFAAAVWSKNNRFYMQGGGSFVPNMPNNSYNDLWEFDLTSNSWRWISGSNLPNPTGFYNAEGELNDKNTIGGRLEAISWQENEQLYIFGGSGIGVNGDVGSRADLWRADLITVLPLQLLEFTAKKNSSAIQLRWNVAKEEEPISYVIERSVDGENFKRLGNVNSDSREGWYSFYDDQPHAGQNVYRLSSAGKNGLEYLGLATANFKFSDNATSFSVFPNPFVNEFTVTYRAKKGEGVQLVVYEIGGRVVQTDRFISTYDGLNSNKITVRDKLSGGAYIVKLLIDGAIESSVLIKQ